jgi:murein DD-endopeptidase MepM/ murein hydrolase activator NlpD
MRHLRIGQKLAKSLILVTLLLSSCSSIKSGRYVKNEKGEWEFVPIEAGISRLFQNFEEVHGTWDGDFMWPVPSVRRISSAFGRRWGRLHHGIDIPSRPGTVIVAADSGKVVYSGNGIRGYGNMVVVSHGSGMKTVYAHNKKNLVKKGQKVHRGQVIGLVGRTGRVTGPHLHFEVRRYGAAQNPVQYFAKKVAKR